MRGPVSVVAPPVLALVARLLPKRKYFAAPLHLFMHSPLHANDARKEFLFVNFCFQSLAPASLFATHPIHSEAVASKVRGARGGGRGVGGVGGAGEV